MIKHLVLNNLVLVDACEVHFGPAFNAVTGETGAGKTALIEAIGLALGERADSSLIRKGCDKAFVEVAFDISPLPVIKEILEEAGLLVEDDLVIRREISKEGKNRAFINCRSAPLPLLQKIGAELIDLIGQHAHHALRTSESQRSLLDLFGSLHAELKSFQSAFAEERACQKKLEELQQLSSQRERDEDTWRFQLEEIEAVSLKKGEEEEVFEKYQRLAHAQELTEKIDMMINTLTDHVVPGVCKCMKACDAVVSYDKSLGNASTLLHEAHIVITEALRTVQSSSQNNECNPKAVELLENRLGAITRLKRKYGQTFEEIETYRQKVNGELARLENLSEELSTAERALTSAKTKTDQTAAALTQKRKKVAEHLQEALTAQLQHLNMNGAEVSIEVAPQGRNTSGDDAVHFWLKANTGERPGLVKEHSSGGELSRLLFAIKIALAEKNNTPTLIFDEIDANVGGKTAAIIGEKLKQLGQYRQVVCITHFPQVASKADAHFGVQKIEANSRTLTQIKPLSKKERDEELLRMLGGTGLV